MLFTPEERQRYARHLDLPGFGAPRRNACARAACWSSAAAGSVRPRSSTWPPPRGPPRPRGFRPRRDFNLQRQILHATPDIGRPKVDSAVGRLRALNPHVRFVPHQDRLDAENARDLFAPYDVVLDCTDNFAAKYLINDICVAMKKPFVHAGISGFCGQLMAVLPGQSACLRCLFPARRRWPPPNPPPRRPARRHPRRRRLAPGRRGHQVPFQRRRAAHGTSC
jgi:molybdopterin/thiamine biosynthesis adenylyltransferase